ncbi:hypothetical protein RB614_14440 [Phytohabitans sp. ZYX-F-186]|uniref:Uncharacterized protein n=1 Tax=Phytohabitans maris TaxID=3071409 RepID=A0ABU0ZF84_9ACTN|nr:hypothetical protein [Phytohabitans sp. ZYX-F-186]MDQ7905714.1 hypothetical protein [Phytohabitans sp. ZYX-F-186]
MSGSPRPSGGRTSTASTVQPAYGPEPTTSAAPRRPARADRVDPVARLLEGTPLGSGLPAGRTRTTRRPRPAPDPPRAVPAAPRPSPPRRRGRTGADSAPDVVSSRSDSAFDVLSAAESTPDGDSALEGSGEVASGSDSAARRFPPRRTATRPRSGPAPRAAP